MRRLAYLFAFSLGLTAVVGADVDAALRPTAIAPAFDSVDKVLLANRLGGRMRFRVRPSRYRRGGISRGNCPRGEITYAISPKIESTRAQDNPTLEDAPTYLTASAHPTFFIKVPELSDAAYGYIYIDVGNSEGVRIKRPQIYGARFELSGKAGVVGIKMPSDAPMLDDGSDYRWRGSVTCNEDDAFSVFRFSGGLIEKVADIEGTREEQFEYYLDQGVWQDVAAIVAEDRYYGTNSAADDEWATLMEDANLSEYASTPIVEIVEATLSEE